MQLTNCRGLCCERIGRVSRSLFKSRGCTVAGKVKRGVKVEKKAQKRGQPTSGTASRNGRTKEPLADVGQATGAAKAADLKGSSSRYVTDQKQGTFSSFTDQLSGQFPFKLFPELSNRFSLPFNECFLPLERPVMPPSMELSSGSCTGVRFGHLYINQINFIVMMLYLQPSTGFLE